MFSGQYCKMFLLSSLELIVLLSIIVICFAKFKSRCLYDTRGFSFLQATPITVSLYLHNLLETSLSSSTIHAARRAISWVHKFAGFEDFNPCEMFLVKSIAEASSRTCIPRQPFRKAEPITPEIVGSIFKHYVESSNLLDIRFVCMCFLAHAGFFRISELLSTRRNNIVTEHHYHEIFVEGSKTDKYREGSWMYVVKTGKFPWPYTYLIKYLKVAGITPFLQDYIFRSLRYDKETKGNVLSSKPLSDWRLIDEYAVKQAYFHWNVTKGKSAIVLLHPQNL